MLTVNKMLKPQVPIILNINNTNYPYLEILEIYGQINSFNNFKKTKFYDCNEKYIEPFFEKFPHYYEKSY